MVFRPRRVGGGPSQGSGFGSGTGGRKTIYGSNNSTKSSQHPQGRYRTSSRAQEAANGTLYNTTQTSVGNNQVSKPVTSVDQRKRWGFYDALVGQRKQREQVSVKERVSARKSFKGDVDDINIRFVDNLKSGEVKWDPRLSKKRLSVDKDISRKDLAKKITKISRKSNKFREQSGLGIITHGKENQILRASRRSRKFIKIKRKMDRNISTKSSRRSMTLGDLLRK